MLSLETIKTGLKLMGFRNLKLVFDSERRCIEAKFDWQGQPYEKTIAFREIEDAFQDAPQSSQ